MLKYCKYSKHGKSVREIEDHYDKLNKYSVRRKLGEEIEDQYLKSQPEETITEKVKLIPQNRKLKKQELD